MVPRISSRSGISLTTAAAVAVLVACTDTPTERVVGAGAEPVAHAQVDANVEKDKGAKKAILHAARVRGDGTLVDGTAISSQRFSEGVYLIKFPPGIGGCAATASSSSFVGFDNSVFRIVAQISIGFGSGGVFDDETVGVSLFSSLDGSSEDSSFSLVMVCP
jgi:hypothetical protein